jgi:putative lipoic acid-binding regulatory protein
MVTDDSRADFYSRFHEQLQNSQPWPGEYMFKFIFKKGSSSRHQLEEMFDSSGATINLKPSSKGAYISMSITTTMANPEAVIAIYKKVEQLQDVITL